MQGKCTERVHIECSENAQTILGEHLEILKEDLDNTSRRPREYQEKISETYREYMDHTWSLFGDCLENMQRTFGEDILRMCRQWLKNTLRTHRRCLQNAQARRYQRMQREYLKNIWKVFGERSDSAQKMDRDWRMLASWHSSQGCWRATWPASQAQGLAEGRGKTTKKT